LPSLLFYVFSFPCSVSHLFLHSFPTRRSSDLDCSFTLLFFDLFFCVLTIFFSVDEAASYLNHFPQIPTKSLCDNCTLKFGFNSRSEEHTSELQSRENLVCRLLLEKKKYNKYNN